MTLSERNTFFKAGIVFCSLITLLVIGISSITLSVYPTMEENTRRPEYLFQSISGLFLKNDYYAVHASLILAVLFSLIGISLIHSFFERTSTPEILYISFFTVSFSLESLRLILPLHLVYNFPVFYLLSASRLLLFARYFGIFSLFTASLFAAGLEVQKTRNVILFIVIAIFSIILGVPIDTLNWDTCFNMVNGYNSMFRMMDAITFIAATITFFAAVKIRGSGEYFFVGTGVMLAMSGRNILLGSDNWAGSILGIVLLSFGTWFICSKLHKIHLWL